MKNKSDVSTIFPWLTNVVEKYFNLHIVALYSINGGEFIKLKSYLSSNGISHYTTPPHTLELNSSAERRRRHIVETARSLFHHVNLTSQFWSFSFSTTTYLINRLPTLTLNMKTPYHTLHNQTYNITRLHFFGCLCFPWLRPYNSNKLHPKYQPCIFVVYSPSWYAYRCLDPITNKIYTSRHVVLYDNYFQYLSLIKSIPIYKPIPSINPHPPHIIIPLNPPPPITSPQPVTTTPTLTTNTSQTVTTTTSTSVANSQEATLHSSSSSGANDHNHVVTRSQNNIFKSKKLYHDFVHPLPENLEQSNIWQAMKHSHWRQAVSEEFDALIRSGTHTLVPPPSHQKLLIANGYFASKETLMALYLDTNHAQWLRVSLNVRVLTSKRPFLRWFSLKS